jgi:rubredoxin
LSNSYLPGGEILGFSGDYPGQDDRGCSPRAPGAPLAEISLGQVIRQSWRAAKKLIPPLEISKQNPIYNYYQRDSAPRRGNLKPPKDRETDAMSQSATEPYWKCSNCNFTIQVAQPPDLCPMCRAKCEFKDVSCYLPECGGPGHIDPQLK